jgi:hypothetical protein
MGIFFNYLFIGVVFTFLLDMILLRLKDNIKVKELGLEESWGIAQRITCIFIWPIAFIVFITTFLKK